MIAGFIYKDEAVFIAARDRLSRRFGGIDFQSGPMDFDCTDHYAKEMGTGLKRRFVSFSRNIPAQELYLAKLYTNRLERRFSAAGLRQVNIDPGYLDLARLVLASTKDYSHRLYLRKGIFAEITMTYRNSTFVPNEWAYPDYRSQPYIDIFNNIRKIYAGQC